MSTTAVRQPDSDHAADAPRRLQPSLEKDAARPRPARRSPACRRAAIARFAELGFPGTRNEDWKFTSVAPLVRTPLLLPGETRPRRPMPSARTCATPGRA